MLKRKESKLRVNMHWMSWRYNRMRIEESHSFSFRVPLWLVPEWMMSMLILKIKRDGLMMLIRLWKSKWIRSENRERIFRGADISSFIKHPRISPFSLIIYKIPLIDSMDIDEELELLVKLKELILKLRKAPEVVSSLSFITSFLIYFRDWILGFSWLKRFLCGMDWGK